MSIWQTESWQKMLILSKQTEQFFVVENVYIEKRKVSLWKYGLFVLWYESLITQDLFLKLQDLCKKENCLFIQVETLSYDINKEEKQGVDFNKGYYKKFITPYTAVIDLEKTEEEILSLMKPKGRYNVRLAEKKWVEVKEVEKNNENIRDFYNLISETTTRNTFYGNTFEYYKVFLENIESSKLLLGYVWDQVIAGGIFIFETDVSIYYYGASTSDKQYRNLMAPYLLQWEAIKLSKNLWSKIYDFLWVASHWENNSSLSWVTDFKWKLTSDVREVSKSYIWINKKLLYNIVVLLRKILK